MYGGEPFEPEMDCLAAVTERPAPSSPSNSSSSGEHTEKVAESPSNHDDESDRKPKRCKISRQQLNTLINSFEEEPLPNFEQRQAIAKQLGMTPRSVQIWFQNRRQRLKPTLPKQSGIGQPIGGGHCLTMPPMRSSQGSSLAHSNALRQAAAAAKSQEHAKPTGLNPDMSNLNMASLAAATGMALGKGAAAGGFESLVLGHAMNQLQHNATLAVARGGASTKPFPTLGPSAMGATLGSMGDVMEPFAATKALLGAGYTPSTNPLASRTAAAAVPPVQPLVPGASGTGLPSQPPIHASAENKNLAQSALASLAASVAAAPSPALSLGDAAAAALAVRAASCAPATASTGAMPKSDDKAADGLMLLLACATGNKKEQAA